MERCSHARNKILIRSFLTLLSLRMLSLFRFGILILGSWKKATTKMVVFVTPYLATVDQQLSRAKNLFQ